MRWTQALGATLLITALVGAEDQKPLLQLGKNDVGKVPAGWKVAKTGTGEGRVWQVVADDTAPSRSGYVLAQTVESPSEVFNVCVAEDIRYKDVELSVAFRAVAGQKDQGGGFVWRYQDNNNYYICLLNPLEDNYRVYKVTGGSRSPEFQEAQVKIPMN
jgi:hypothetical protein